MKFLDKKFDIKLMTIQIESECIYNIVQYIVCEI